ncbi:hypothetical protein WG66_005018 [Moniliophthora roreri]|uniref:Peptidase A1 domain-containing protein n=1 Tax=Moniliophthora roreri TaxID=221103 RepID=A0A0W0FSU7_MONRR|nr:hypothetical protein WG66_005018 [Moniliophthora roreri]
MWAFPASLLLFLSPVTFGSFVGQRRTENGLHVPIYKAQASNLQRRAAAIGLGDCFDVTYNVLLSIGNTEVPLILDSGSSDCWVLSDFCNSPQCSDTLGAKRYPQSSLRSTGLDVRLLYGDSFTGTHALGLIGRDMVNLAGLGMQDQYFGAINSTNTSVLRTGSSGILGLGFPINSMIWFELFKNEYVNSNQRREDISLSRRNNFRRPSFPPISELTQSWSLPSRYEARQESSSRASIIAELIMFTWPTYGPLMNRIIASFNLAPMVTIILQRNTIDIGGNAGLLSIGELPFGVKNESLTWVSLRSYPPEEGGLNGPPDSPNEVYPIAWEIPIDDVYFDGEKLPPSALAAADITLSALVDTGNSLLRGPPDTVREIQERLGGFRFACDTPHTLAFVIGGKMFPVDPRDFITQIFEDSVETCGMNVVATDTPTRGDGYLYSWSLGVPFLKSVLSSYYYGNLTHPSHGPPRLGFLSTVPPDANERYRAAFEFARDGDGNFPGIIEEAPTSVPAIATTNSDGVPLAQPSVAGSRGTGRTNTATAQLIRTPSPLHGSLIALSMAAGTMLWS